MKWISLVTALVACCTDFMFSQDLNLGRDSKSFTVLLKDSAVRINVNLDSLSLRTADTNVRYSIVGGSATEGIDYYVKMGDKQQIVGVLITTKALDGATIVFKSSGVGKDSINAPSYIVASVKKLSVNPPGLYLGVGASLNFEGDSPFFLGGFYGEVRLAFEDDLEKRCGWGIDLGLTSAKALPFQSLLAASYIATRLKTENGQAVVDSFVGNLTTKVESRSYTVFANNLFRFSRFTSTLKGVTRLYFILPRIEAGMVQSRISFDSADVRLVNSRAARESERGQSIPIGDQGAQLAGYISAELGTFLHMTRDDGLDVRLGVSSGLATIFKMGYYAEVQNRIFGSKTTMQFYIREPTSGISISSDVSYFHLFDSPKDESGSVLFSKDRFLCSVNVAKSFSLSGLF